MKSKNNQNKNKEGPGRAWTQQIDRTANARIYDLRTTTTVVVG